MNNLEEFLKLRAEDVEKNTEDAPLREPLTTKTAIELILSGKLKERVCKFCLHIDSNLYQFDQIFEIMGDRTMPVKVTVKDMIGNIYPFQLSKDLNLPNSVCNTCINRIISSYLFGQQCDRAERALNNCIEDVYTKMTQLDPLDKPKTRGRQKLNPNTNTIHAEFGFVIDYANTLMTLISHGNHMSEDEISALECKKCWKVFPNMEQLLNHETIHPKSMWYSCRICGLSMPKINTYKKHIKNAHKPSLPVENKFICKCDCGNETDNYSEHLQHIEKHKFKVILQHAIDGKMEKLCSVCLEKKAPMNHLGTSIRLHGGYPEITGNHSLSNILLGALPERNQQNANKYRPLPFTNVAEMMKLKLKSVEKKKIPNNSIDIIESKKEYNIIDTKVEKVHKANDKVEEYILKNKFEFSLPENIKDFINKKPTIKTNYNKNNQYIKPEDYSVKKLCLCYSKTDKKTNVSINVKDNDVKTGQKRMIEDSNYDEKSEYIPKKIKVEISPESNVNEDVKISNNCLSVNNIRLDRPTKSSVLKEDTTATSFQRKDALEITDEFDKVIENDNINISTLTKCSNLEEKKNDNKNSDEDIYIPTLVTPTDESKEQSVVINKVENLICNYTIAEPPISTDEPKLGDKSPVNSNKDEHQRDKENIGENYSHEIIELPITTSEYFQEKNVLLGINREIDESLSQVSKQDMHITNQFNVAPTSVIKKQEVDMATQTEIQLDRIQSEAIIPLVETPKHTDIPPQRFFFDMPSSTNIVSITPPIAHIEKMDIDDFALHYSANNVEFSIKPVNLVQSFSLPNIPMTENVTQQPIIENISQNFGPTPTIPILQFSMGSGNVNKELPPKKRRFIKAKRRHN